MENGLFAGGNGSDPSNKGNSAAFVTAVLKNNGTTTYAIKDANAQSGSLTTEYSGPLPDMGGIRPMHQEGAVILGTGGDNSNGSDGSFFEGVITAGYPSDATDNAVQANIVHGRLPAGQHRLPENRHPYTITNVNSGKMAEPSNCATTNGTGIVLGTLGGTCPQWTFSSAGSGHYVITNVNSGEVLDSVRLRGIRRHPHRPVVLARQPVPEWDVTAVGGHYTISNVANGMVLDAEDCETADGTIVRQWAQLDNTCQQWDIGP